MVAAHSEADEDCAVPAQSDGHEPCSDMPSEWSGRRRTQSDLAMGATEPAPVGDRTEVSGFVIAQGAVVGGRYRLDHVLGEGGMGIVWAAHHTVTRRPVALKFLKGLRDDSSRRRLVREARAAGSIQHPGIVAVHDILESDDGEPALVMDLLDGESLRARLLREKSLTLPETSEVLVALCEALGAAHAAGVIHRDLKPENLFRLKDGSMRVLDFGVAKIVPLDARTAQSVGTQTGDLVGTPMFMSPEQVFGEKDIDHRSDLWSLGLIAYECLTGTLPTASDNLGQVLKIIVSQGIQPLKVAAPGLPEEVCAIVDRMLSYDRNARPSSAGEVAAVFARVTGREPPVISPPRSPTPSASESSSIRPVRTRADALTRPRHETREGASRGRWAIVAVVAFAGLGAAAIVRHYGSSNDTAPVKTQTLTTPTAAPTSQPIAMDEKGPAPPAPTSSASSATPSGLTTASVGGRAKSPPHAPATSVPTSSAIAIPAAPPAPSSLQGAVVKNHPF